MVALWSVAEKDDGSKTVLWDNGKTVQECGTVDANTPREMIDIWLMLNSLPGDLLSIGGRIYFKQGTGAWA